MSLIKLNNNAVKNIDSVGSVSTGDMVFISKATASSSASIEFSLGDYKEYQFYYVNCEPSSTYATFSFQTSIDNGSTYGVTCTSTFINAYHNEGDTDASLGYNTGRDLAQSTNFQQICQQSAGGNDSNNCGILKLFNPSSSTYVKHFINRATNSDTVYAWNVYVAGYFNTTSALTNIKFKMNTGNINAGSILMFGIN